MQRVLEVDGYPVFFQNVGERLVRQFLDRRHTIASKLLELVEGVIVESDQLAHSLGRLLDRCGFRSNRDRNFLFHGNQEYGIVRRPLAYCDCIPDQCVPPSFPARRLKTQPKKPVMLLQAVAKWRGRMPVGSVIAKKTRPPAEYDASATLPCPDIEIGLRHPVEALWPRFRRADVIHFTTGSANCGWPAAIASASSRPPGLKKSDDGTNRKALLGRAQPGVLAALRGGPLAVRGLARTDVLRGDADAGLETSAERALANDCRRPSIAPVSSPT